MLICHVILFDNCHVNKKLPLIFKRSTKSLCLTNVKVSILLDYVLQRCSWGCKNTSIFLLKNFIQCGDGDEVRIPEPIGDGDEIQFLIPVGYG